MPRDSGGTYTLPASNPVISGTIIESSWANNTMGDIGNEITDSLSRTGNGAMLAPLRVVDGSASTPSLTFVSDVGTGRSLTSNGVMVDSVSGVEQVRYTAAGVEIANALTSAGLTNTGDLNNTGTVAVTGAITATDNVTAYLTSDERLKTDIREISDPLTKVETLRAVTYDKVIDKVTGITHFETGLIAQDVAKVIKDLVHTNDDGDLVIRTGGLELTALLVGAVKELAARVTELEHR